MDRRIAAYVNKFRQVLAALKPASDVTQPLLRFGCQRLKEHESNYLQLKYNKLPCCIAISMHRFCH